MKKIFNIIMIGALVLAQSCSEYLDEVNPNELSVDTYWKTLDESESNLTSVYGGMLDQFVLGTEVDFTRTDMVFPGLGRLNAPNYGLYNNWYTFGVGPDNRDLGDLWDSKYRVVFRANQVIQGLQSMSEDLKSQDKWTEQMAQARFFRGLMHFFLHATFNNGKIIIRDVIPTNSNEYGKALSSSEEVIAFFREDLEFAYNNLPPQMEPKSRVDAGVAATVLGTSYLYEGNYSKAAEYFSDIVNNERGDYGYALEQDVTKMFTNAGDFNSESIFEVNYSTNLKLEQTFFDEESFFHRLARRTGPNGRNLVTNQTYQTQGWIVPSAWLTYEFSNEPMDSKDPRNYIDGDITGTMKNVSLRSQQSIAVVNDESVDYYGSTAPNVFSFRAPRNGLFKKFTNHDIVTTEQATGTSGWKSGRNLIVYRLSGVYLMYAECLVKTGDIAGALKYINDIRMRWGLQLLGPALDASHDYDGLAYDETALMNHLMYKEYPLELAFEGYSTRFLNMRRWGIQKERFEELSKQPMHLINYTYIRENGREGTRNGSLVQMGEANNNEFFQYIEAANAWQSAPEPGSEIPDTGYYYLQLPNSEILYNPNSN
ncbi:RagB/SusD family nutrient uptake outer membrane protein [Algibacter mikhailovii]|uniref:RagB/SusD family nutrient uptake outer membrane protein n=1 Tax=Algibacter mikhailovii TaxID=425498 RepID=UPI0024946030|nr:RagB/SusD family nutrient uptake outer membrane protein [Algibacter mikhailovii]